MLESCWQLKPDAVLDAELVMPDVEEEAPDPDVSDGKCWDDVANSVDEEEDVEPELGAKLVKSAPSRQCSTHIIIGICKNDTKIKQTWRSLHP